MIKATAVRQTSAKIVRINASFQAASPTTHARIGSTVPPSIMTALPVALRAISNPAWAFAQRKPFSEMANATPSSTVQNTIMTMAIAAVLARS